MLSLSVTSMPAATGGQELVAVEAEAGDIAEVSALGAPVPGAQALGGVLDDRQAELPRRLQQRGHLDGMAQDVNRQMAAHPPSGRAIVQRAVAPLAAALEELHTPAAGPSASSSAPRR